MLVCSLLSVTLLLCTDPPTPWSQSEQIAAIEAAVAELELLEPEPEPEPENEPVNTARADDEGARYGVDEPWASLAECESGDWLNGGESVVEGSARWAWGGDDPIPPWGTSVHDGGLQFAPDTWAWLAPDVLDDPPARAYDATPQQQVAVAERVLDVQGWRAWPVCSRKLGLR